MRRLAALGAAFAVACSLAVLGVPAVEAPRLAAVAADTVDDAHPYEGWKGGSYACNALELYPDLAPTEVAAWLVESRGFTADDAAALVELALDHGCDGV